jgi:hypothetical protein
LAARKENYQEEIEENIHNKSEYVRKVDDYVNKYKILKQMYYQVIKDLKSK